ncbi:molybdopterin adenylyltransferase [Thermoflavimicrobium daqui]|uniref:Molybdopterin adenylyltransferase n=1 Tax=Thermoflavimicrobium daqui TaxID=2137476 RepID=A0A364K7A0_9BACL|nr:molybdopterin adenylyltransferase [Thermoflavimicrobium daqui]RAL26092.1 molybdopterin adenylyltransferase [Thermoflavimicrobium daqui]
MSWKIGIITVSDRGTTGERIDLSGPALVELCNQWEVIAYEIIPDDQKTIEETLVQLADEKKCDLIFTTGGTGFAPRDVTPEATKAVIHKEVPGIPEAMRSATLTNTKFAILSRAIAGIRNQTLIINFPGSPKGVKECFAVIVDVLPHALQVLTKNVSHD